MSLVIVIFSSNVKNEQLLFYLFYGKGHSSARGTQNKSVLAFNTEIDGGKAAWVIKYDKSVLVLHTSSSVPGTTGQ